MSAPSSGPKFVPCRARTAASAESCEEAWAEAREGEGGGGRVRSSGKVRSKEEYVLKGYVVETVRNANALLGDDLGAVNLFSTCFRDGEEHANGDANC